ncbi:MAG: GTPase Era [Anaerolineae bacterium]|nr:GTPase Era [Anaerolineae bacterium]
MTESVPESAINPLPEPQLAHSGYIAVVGRPNVGKSTLMNHILGEKIAIVSPKPQTTRLTQLGIYTEGDVQAIFVDTPGIHKPRHSLGQFMVAIAVSALRDADVILFVVDCSDLPNEEDKRVAQLIRESGSPALLAINKMDRVKPEDVQPHVDAYRALVPNADWTTLIAKLGDGVPEVLKRLIEKLPAGPQYYPEDQLSDTAVRQIASEIIREKVMHNTEREVPHAVAVEVDEFKERSATLTYIGASIYVERDTQKPIIIGKGGALLKKISTEARTELETLTNTQVYLELRVKVHKDWRSDDAFLQRMGYKLRKDR